MYIIYICNAFFTAISSTGDRNPRLDNTTEATISEMIDTMTDYGAHPCIQSNELTSTTTLSTDGQGDDPDISMEAQRGSECDTSPEVSSTSCLLELG
jgi:hypothetical protein